MTTGLAASTPIYSRSLELGADRMCEAVACGDPDLALSLLAAAWLAAVALVAAAAIAAIRDGQSACEEERARTVAEREAFGRFARRVAGLDASPVGGVETHHGDATLVRARTGDGQLRRVREAYRETVMSVPHYEEEYDESLAANVAGEFGEEVATVVVNGTRLTPQLREALVERSRQARRRRDRFVRVLDAEADALDDAAATLRAVETDLAALDDRPLAEKSFGDLAADFGDLDDLATDVDALLADRQAAVHAGRRGDDPGRHGHDFQAYLYGDGSTRYPVLDDALGVLSTVRAAKRRVARSLTARA